MNWRHVRGTGSSSYMEWKMRRKEKEEMERFEQEKTLRFGEQEEEQAEDEQELTDERSSQSANR